MEMAVKDILLGDDGDLIIKNGDFLVGDSDVQHVNDIIEASPGYYKQFPILGVGIDSYMNSSGKEQQLNNAIRINLESDSYQLNGVDILTDAGIINSNTQIYVDANRIKL